MRFVNKLKWFITGWRKYIVGVIFLTLSIFFIFCLPAQLFNKPTSTILLDKNGQLLSARIATDGQWRFPHNDSVPDKFKICLIEFEDRKFDSHFGVHIPSIFRAIFQNISAGEIVSGGSTISMQVIRMSRDNPKRSIGEKFLEMIRAVRLETRFNKEEIISIYASNAPMGGNVVGLDAASWRYFNRSPFELSWAESATLAVLPNAPSLIYPGKNQEALLKKRDRLLNHLFNEGIIDETTLNLSLLEPLPEKTHRLPQSASHLTDYFIKNDGTGKRYVTSIDKSLQLQSTEILERHSDFLSESQIHNAAVLIIDVKNNKVLTYVGNSKSKDKDKGDFVDIIRSPRSTGSILKPFLYAHMLNDGELLPEMLINDVPVNFSGYSPKNYSYQYEGSVAASRALSKSLNVPSVYMLRDYGVQKCKARLNKMNFHNLNRPSSEYGLSLILGGGEASLWELTNAYAAMSRDLGAFHELNGKYYSDSYEWASFDNNYTRTQEINDHSQLNAASVYLTYEALLKVNRPSNEIGWENYSSSHKIAWKTGTSFGFRDAWAIGATPDYVVGVWVGNADGEGRPGIVGVKAAAPLLFDIFDLLPSSGWFYPPYDDMKEVHVCSVSGFLAGPHCSEKDTVLVPDIDSKTEPCPFHRIIHLNEDGNRVTRECLDDGEQMTSKSWFVLPAVQEWYYRKRHPEYISLPEIDISCPDQSADNPIDLIYPDPNMKIYLPVDIDGKLSSTVFKAAHRQVSGKIYWHLDHIYVGETTEIHQIELQPESGDHFITLIDESGYSLTRKFTILKKDDG